jgi:chaperonin GroEL
MTILTTLALLRQTASGEQPQKLLQRLQDEARVIQELIQVETRWPVLKELQELLEDISLDDFERDLVLTAIDLAGLEGRIFVETTSSSRSSIEQSQDHSFQLSPVPEVVDPTDFWSGNNVRVGIIDGMIERVSEIHAILESASNNAEPMVLFCRGYSEEVVATLGLNRKRGTLNVIPIIVPFDVDSANSLKDVAVILDCDIVTALQGQLISSLTWDDMAVADEIQWSAGVLSIRSEKGVSGLATHTAHLMKRRADLPPDGRRDILDDRIRSLSAFGIAIKVGGMEAVQHAQSIDVLLRSVRAIITYGLVDSSAVLKRIDSKVHRVALEKCNFLGSKPAISLAAVIKYSTEATASIVNAGAAILLDR